MRLLATAAVGALARVDARKRLDTGQTVRLAVDPEDVHLFDAESGERVVV